LLKGGVIMDVTNAEQAQIAEKAGACAVMRWSVCLRTFAKKAGGAHGLHQNHSRDHENGDYFR